MKPLIDEAQAADWLELPQSRASENMMASAPTVVIRCARCGEDVGGVRDVFGPTGEGLMDSRGVEIGAVLFVAVPMRPEEVARRTTEMADVMTRNRGIYGDGPYKFRSNRLTDSLFAFLERPSTAALPRDLRAWCTTHRWLRVDISRVQKALRSARSPGTDRQILRIR